MTDSDQRVTRRRVLAALGATAATASLAGCPGDDSPGPGPPPTATEGTSTEREAPTVTPPEDLAVVDVVEEGASPDGDEPVGSVVESLMDDGTALYFPPGEYLVEDVVRRREFEDLALFGEDATIRPVQGYENVVFALGGTNAATGLTVRGLEFDVSAPDTGIRPIDARVTDGLQVSDVTVRGEQDADQDCARFDVTGEDGTGVVERLALPDGAGPEYPVTGCYVGESHVGTLEFVDCEIAGFPDNGLYASPATGRVNVVGGRYENSDVSNVRVSGPATISGVTVRCDASPETYQNMRGIRLREGADVLVENCMVDVAEVSHSDGAITCSNWLDAATIRNTYVGVDADGVPGILAKRPSGEEGGDDDYRLRIEGVTVAGTSGTSAAVRLLARSRCLVDDVCIHQTGADRNGVHCTGVRDSTLRDSDISVTGSPVVLDDATVTREDLRTETLSGDEGGEASGCQ